MSDPPYKVVNLPAVDRALQRLPRDVQKRLAPAMRDLGWDPRPPGFGPVKSRPGCFRVRVSDWRILYRIDDTTHVVTILEIMPRQNDYRRR